MVNYNGIKTKSRTGSYVVYVGNKYYYYDANSTLRGPHDTEAEAIEALEMHFNTKSSELSGESEEVEGETHGS